MKRYEPDISCGVAFSDVAIMTERKTGEYVEYTDAMKAAERTPLELAAPDLLEACRYAEATLRRAGYPGDAAMIAAAIAKAESEATT